MLKKTWIIFMVLVLALPLSACGNSANDSNDQISMENSSNTNTNTNANTNTDVNTNTNVNTDANTDTNSTSDTNNTSTTTNVGYKDVKLTPEEVYDIYVEKYPNVKVNKLELDPERGSYVYEVEGYDDTNKYELKIDPVDGKILNEEQNKRDDNDKKGEISLENVSKIQELVDKALLDAGNNYKVDMWELKSNDNEIIFEIDVIDANDHDIEYKYNVSTMELIEKD